MLQRVTDPLGNVTSYDYDAVGRLTSLVDPSGNVAGANPADHTWRYGYDREDRVITTTVPAPAAGGSALLTKVQYDPVGNPTVITDALSQVTKYAYDERDSLLRVLESPTAWTDSGILPSGVITTEYSYDGNDNLTRVLRAKGTSDERATDYQYDGLDRLVKEIQYPSWPTTTSTLTTQYTYDGNGNRTGLLDPNGQTTTFRYDSLNRLTNITYTYSVTTPNVSYAYDADGHRTSMVDGTGTTSYGYDELGRVLTVTTPGPRTVRYRYDRDGNQTKLFYPDGSALTSGFDKGGRLTSLVDWGNRTTTYDYFPTGALKTVTNTNGTTARYSYDNALRLTQVLNARSGVTLTSHTYGLDLLGNRTAVSETTGITTTSGTTSYSYDRLSRLTGVTPPTGSATAYTYDPVGNRLTKSRGTTTSYSYDKADRLTAAGAVSYTFDANGNQTAWGSRTFSYDQANRLLSTTLVTATTSFVYEGDGNRVRKSYCDCDPVTATLDTNGALPVLLDDGDRKYVWGNGLAYAVTGSGLVLTYHADGLGSVRALSDASGAITQTYQTDEFGIPSLVSGPSSQPLRYTGEQWDVETGLLYLRARYYDPYTGRFLQKDPFRGSAVVPCSLNRYVYARNNPTRFVDPSGRTPGKPGQDQDFPSMNNVGRFVGCMGVVFVGFQTGLLILQVVSGATALGGAALGEAIAPAGGAVPGLVAGAVIGTGVGLYLGNKASRFLIQSLGCPEFAPPEIFPTAASP